MLTPELIKKIKRIHIASGRVVDSMMAGHYRSAFRGSGIEFEEVREYSPGDEVKSIDWKVTARMGRPYVKLFREERELVIMLLVDLSASARFGTTSSIKIETTTEVASILAFNAIRNNDKVGAVLFTDRVERYIPPKKGSAHVWRVIKEILSFRPRGKGTDIDRAAGFLAKVCRKKTVSFLISDFVATGYIQALKRLNRRHDLIAVLVSDPGDFRLPSGGVLETEDLETGRRVLVDCSDRSTREAFARRQETWYQETCDTLTGAKIDHIELHTDGSTSDALYTFFRYREKRLR